MKWTTRLSRQTEKRIYYYATVILVAVLGGIEIYRRFHQWI
ncbi:MAG: hypothetical protein WAK57_11205 [Desulfobacterales bacterium]|jgi:hypothetical protein